MKKRKTVMLFIIISVVILFIGAFVFTIIKNYNKQFIVDKHYFTVFGVEKYIEIPGRCKLSEVQPFSGFWFVTDKSVEEVLEFYDNYTKDRQQINGNYGRSDITKGYYIESASLVILEYEASETADGKTFFEIDYHLMFDESPDIKIP